MLMNAIINQFEKMRDIPVVAIENAQDAAQLADTRGESRTPINAD